MKKSPTTQFCEIGHQWRPNHHSLNAVNGKTYALQHKADLTDFSWTTQLTNLLGVVPLSSVTIELRGTKGFYQIAVE